MARKKISTTVYLTEGQVSLLKELHARTRVPIAEYIRMGIDMVLDQNSNVLPGQTSLFGELPKMNSKSEEDQSSSDPSKES